MRCAATVGGAPCRALLALQPTIISLCLTLCDQERRDTLVGTLPSPATKISQTPCQRPLNFAGEPHTQIKTKKAETKLSGIADSGPLVVFSIHEFVEVCVLIRRL